MKRCATVDSTTERHTPTISQTVRTEEASEVPAGAVRDIRPWYTRADEGTSEWQDWLVDETPDQETRLGDSEEYNERMAFLASAMSDLNDREKAIFQARRLKEDPATLEELAQ